MEMRLIVIRTPDIEQMKVFYGMLGISFQHNKHKISPYHYSASVGKTVIELYPLAQNQFDADKNLRLGFCIEHFEETTAALKEKGIPFLSELSCPDFGNIAVIEDPDGRKIELYQS